MFHKRCWSGCNSRIVLCFIFFGLVIFFASTIDIKSAFATFFTTPIQYPRNGICLDGHGPINVLNVAYPDSRLLRNYPGCSYSYEIKPCPEIWGPKICAQAKDPYHRTPGSMHIVVTIEFHHSIDRSSLRPLMPPGSPDATVVLSKSGDRPGVIPIDILPIQCHLIDIERCGWMPNLFFEIRTLKPYTDPDVLGPPCGTTPFFLHLGQVRDIHGSILDGDYDGVAGGDYHMRFSPPPC